LQTPATLLSPSYDSPDKTTAHRTYPTIQGLSDRLGVPIVSDFAEGDEPALAASVVSSNSGVVLICWEHDHIPALATALPTVAGTVIPSRGPATASTSSGPSRWSRGRRRPGTPSARSRSSCCPATLPPSLRPDPALRAPTMM